MRRIILSVVGLLLSGMLVGQTWDWALHLKSTGDNTEVVDVIQEGNYLYAYGIFRLTLTIAGEDYVSTGLQDIFLVKTDLSGAVHWVRTAGSTGNEVASHVGVDADGNVYISGGFQNTSSFNGQNITSSGAFDGFIAKYNSSGTIQWARNIAWGPNNDRVTGMAVRGDGTIIVAGLFINAVTIGDGVSSNSYNALTDPRRMFMASFGTNGTFNWSREFRNTGTQTIFRAVSLADDNSIYIGGALGGTITMGGQTYTSVGSGDLIVARLTPTGDVSWVRRGGASGTNDDQLNSVFAHQGDVYAIGYVQGTGTIDSTSTAQSTPYIADGWGNIFAMRYNSEGRLIWKRAIGGTGADSGYGIQIHENILVSSGFFSNNNVVFNNTTLNSGGGNDAGFFVFDLDGNPITAGSVSGALEDRGQGVIYDGQGNTIIGGFFRSNPLTIPGLTTLSNSSPMDGFMAKFRNPFSAVFSHRKHLTCNGANDGELTVTTYFGTGPYTYVWRRGGVVVPELTGPVATGLQPGVYQVTVTDSSNPVKTATTTFNIAQPAAITTGGVTPTHVSCPNGSNGAITLVNPTGGTGALTYQWTTDNGFGVVENNRDQTGLTAGTYYYTISDTRGCTLEGSVTITQPLPIAIAGSITGITGGANGAVTISSVTGGTGPYTYSWAGPSGFSSTSMNISSLTVGGDYTLTVTDSRGCTQAQMFHVTDDTKFSIWISSTINVSCHGGSDGTATVSYYIPPALPPDPVTYSWTPLAGSPVISTSATASGLAAGTYTVTVTYNSTDYIISNIIITQPPAPITGAITTTATRCPGGADGKAILAPSDGTLPYTYVWRNALNQIIATTKDLFRRPAGDYSVTVTDRNGCTATFSTTISQPNPTVISITETPISCFGFTDGQLSITNINGGTAPYQQMWSNTLTAPTITNLRKGVYSVTVTDALGCQSVQTATVTEPAQLSASFTVTNVRCHGGSDGRIEVHATGGTPVYEYSIGGGAFQSNSDFQGLPAGIHAITIRDSRGCTRSFNTTISQPTAMSSSPIITHPTCPESTNGSINATMGGGTTPRTFWWTGPGITNQEAENQSSLGAGNYNLRVTDANSCVLDLIFTLTAINTAPIANISSSAVGNTICLGQGVIFTATGGEQYEFYLNGALIQGPSTSNTYTTSALANNDAVHAVVISAAGCRATSSTITTTVNPLPTPHSLTGGGSYCSGGAGVEIGLSGSQLGVNYQLFRGVTQVGVPVAGTGDAISFGNQTVAGTYTAMASNATSGCENSMTGSASVTVNPLPNAFNVTGGGTYCSGGSGVNIGLSGSQGGVNYQLFRDGTPIGPVVAGSTFALDFGAFTAAGTYTVSAVNATTFCSRTMDGNASVIIETNAISGTLTKTPNAASVCMGTDVSATLTPGLGGNGTDELEYRTHNGTAWGSWNTYISGNTISTAGLTGVEIRTRRLANVCANASYNTVSWSINPLLPVSVSIAANPSGPICVGTPVTFTATPTNGGGSPSYQWRLNGGNVGTNQATYTNPSLANGDVVTVVLTSSAPCAAGSPATSNAIAMAVNPSLPVSVAIAANPSGAICAGTPVTFTATPTNGGGSPTYQWRLNGGNVGTNQATYTSTTLSNGDVVTVVLTSNALCAAGSPATSNAIAMAVNPNLPVSVAIAANPAGAICEGTSVTFTATPTNGGGSPTYQWRLNGGNVGTNQATYTNPSLANGDVVTVVLTSNAPCAAGSPATSNAITMAVSSTPIGGAVSGGSTICSGSSSGILTLSGHTGDVVRWQSSVNLTDWTDIAHTSITYTSSALTQTTHFRAVVQASGCAETVSSHATVTVTPSPTPFSLSGGGKYCEEGEGRLVSLTGSQLGVNYQLQRQGVNVGAPIPGTGSPLGFGLQLSGVYMVVATHATTLCSSNMSNMISITTNPLPNTFAVTGGGSYCQGSTGLSVGLSGSQLGIEYKLMLDGIATGSPVTGNGSAIDFGVQTLAGVYTVLATNTTTLCERLMSNSVSIIIKDIPEPTISTSDATTICEGVEISVNLVVDIVAADAYQWLRNGEVVVDATSPSMVATADGTYSVEVTIGGCIGVSNGIGINIAPLPVPTISTTDALTYCEYQGISVSLGVNIADAQAYQWLLNGESLLGATASTLVATEIGIYSLEVSVENCTGISNELEIIVTPSPTPTISTLGTLSYCFNEAISTLLETSIPNAQAYQWLLNGEIIPDALDASFLATQVGTYSVEVTVDGCNGISNDLAIILKDTPVPTISTPDALTYCSYDLINAIFEVDITDAEAYQWLLNGVVIPGAVSISNIADGPGVYSVEVIVNGCTETSNELEVVVNQAPEPIISTTDTLTYCSLADINVTLVVDVASADAYRWFLNGDVIVYAVSSSYTATEPGEYSVEITKNGCIGVSNILEVVYIPMPSLSINTENSLTFCQGEGVSVLLTVDLEDADTYQWLHNGQPIAGADTTSYLASEAGAYSVEVIKGGCIGVSNSLTISITPLPVASISTPDIRQLCWYDNISVAFEVDITDAQAYQWLLNGDSIPDATTNQYTATTIGDYSVLVTQNGCTGSSNPLVVGLIESHIPEISTTNQLTWCVNSQVGVTFKVTNTNPEATYQWMLNGIAIVDAVADTFAATAAGTYSVVSTLRGCTEGSNSLEVVQGEQLYPILTAINPTEYCMGDSILVTLTVSIPNADSYVWFRNNQPIDGAGGATIDVNQGGVYHVEVNQDNCSGVSNSVEVVVKSLPNPIISTSNQLSWCTGDPVSVTFQTNIENADLYQWLLDGVAIGNETAPTITASSTGTYSALVMVNGCSGYSNAIAVVQGNELYPQLTATPLTICEGDEVEATLSVNIPNATYSWFLNDTPVVGANSNILEVNQPGTYRVEVAQSSCAGTSNDVVVAIIPLPTPVISTVDSTLYCEGDAINTTFGVNIENASTYVWLHNGQAVTDANSYSYTATAQGSYWVEVLVNGCWGTSEADTIVLNPLPTISIPTDWGICQGESVTLTATGNAESYTWDNNVVNGTAFSPSATRTYIALGENPSTGCSVSDSVTISVNPLPRVSIPSGARITEEGTYNFDAGEGFSSFLWSNGSSQQEFTAIGSMLGVGVHPIWVEVTNTFGCKTRKESIVEVTRVSGIQSVTQLTAELYPNPTRGRLSVNLSGISSGTVTIRVQDIAGKQIVSKELYPEGSQLTEELYLHDLAKGICILIINNGQRTIVQKVMLE